MQVCPGCGESSPDRFSECPFCGKPLAERREAQEERKVLTVVFCDLKDSTALGERLDPESLGEVLDLYFTAMTRVLKRHGGAIQKFIGDAVVAAFGIPLVHEDDALRAVRAAVEMRDAAARVSVRLPDGSRLAVAVRIGVNTGPVLAGDGRAGGTFVTGDAVNVAARLQQRAERSEILVGATTQRLVRDAVTAEPVGSLAVRGRDGDVTVWRLVAVDPDAPGHARRLDAPLVARERELAQLRDAFESAAADRACVLFTVLGSAGVGKSRLVHEFLAGTRERATVLRGRCLPYGEGITWWPVADTVRAAAGITDEDDAAHARERIERLFAGAERAPALADRVAAVLGLGAATGTSEESMWALRRLYELVAADRPLVVVFDDVHWGEPTFLDFVEHVADWSRDAPILLLCIARPELLEERPNWGGGKLRARTVLLEPLSGDAVDQLVEHLVGGSLDSAVVTRISQAAEGNPLYVEEFLEMLVDDGLLRRDDEGWVADGDLSNVAVPPTVAALLASRLDRLGPPERTVVERAAVVGKVFWRGALAELSPAPVRPELDRHLLALVRKELVRPDDSTSALADDAFRFRHLLVRDAAYDAVPKHDRADLHEGFAAWLTRTAADRVAEYEEVIGYHLEQAARYRREIGGDADATDTARQAGAHLGRAGRRAVLLGDIPAASALISRAVALLPEADEERASLLVELIEARIEAGSFEEARRLADDVVALEERHPPLARFAWVARIFARLADVLRHDSSAEFASVLPLFDSAVEHLEAAGDDHGLALAWLNRGLFLLGSGRLADGSDASRRGLVHAERAGAPRLMLEAAAQLAASEFYGMAPVESVRAAVEAFRDRARQSGSRMAEARANGYLGRVAALEGRWDEARATTQAAVDTVDELRRPLYGGGSRHWTAFVEIVAEDWARAAEIYEESAAMLDAIGERAYLSTSLAELAHAQARLGRYEEARAGATRAMALGAADDAATQAVSRMALAEASAASDLARAAALARDALALADRSEYSAERLRARLTLARVLARAGGVEEARRHIEEAMAIGRARNARGLMGLAERALGVLEAGTAARAG